MRKTKELEAATEESSVENTAPMTVREKAKLAHDLSSALDDEELQKAVLKVKGGTTLWRLLVASTEKELNALMGDTAEATEQVSQLLSLISQLEGTFVGMFEKITNSGPKIQQKLVKRQHPSRPLPDFTKPMTYVDEDDTDPFF